MASTLADTFLDDLNDLEGSDDDENEQEEYVHKNNNNNNDDLMNDLEDSDDDDNDNGSHDDAKTTACDDLDVVLGKIASAKGFDGTSQLRSSKKYQARMKQVKDSLNLSSLNSNVVSDDVDPDVEYQLVIDCNDTILEIDEEVNTIYRFVSEVYSKKFPELESLIPNKTDYVKTVERIGNEMDMTLLELNDLLPSATVMVVSVTGSTTAGQPLSPSELVDCNRGCAEIQQLDQERGIVLQFVQSRMSRIAPNTCLLIGSRVAAQLIGLAGGLEALSRIPACNIQVMGQEKRGGFMAGFSNLAVIPHVGIIAFCDLVQDLPPFLRKKAVKVISGKVALTARIDSYENHPDGEEGKRFRKEIEEKFEKLQAPNKAKTKKALPIPEDKRKSKRGGKRVRRFKERFAMTEMRAQQNKMNFKVDEGEYGDSAMGVDLGMLSSAAGSGKLRAPQEKKIANTMSKKQKKAISMSSGQTNGLSSSLVFTPVQGLELCNPQAALDKVKQANEKWFDASSGFVSAMPTGK
jgi:U4/U6 small nuclear ribonucleoprotein PRP31